MGTVYIYGNTVIRGALTASGSKGGTYYPALGYTVPGTYYIRNNIAYNNGNPSAPGYGRSIYIDEDATVYFEHNTLAGNYGPGGTSGSMTGDGGNLFYSNSTDCDGCGGTNFTGVEADFENYGGGNLHLSSGSPGAKDALGSSYFTGGYNQDLDGQTRPVNGNYDWGADEYDTSTIGNRPVISITSVSQKTDGTEILDIAYTGSDANNSEVYYTRPGPAKKGGGYSYNGNRGCAYTLLNSGTRWLAIDDITIFEPALAIFDGSPLTFSWNLRRALPMIEERAKVRLQANNWLEDSILVESSIFTIDTMAPRGLANLHQIDASTTSITLAWEAAEDANFYTYMICSAASGVALDSSCSGVDVSNGAGYESLGTASTNSFVFGGLSDSTPYAFNIFVYDAYGHVVAASAEGTDLTTAAPGGGGGSINYVMVSDTNQVPQGNVEKNDLPSAIYAFRLYTGSGSVIVDKINLSLVNAVQGTDVSNPYLYYDNGVLGVFEPGTDSTVTNLGWDGTYYNHTDLTETVDSNGTNFIVTLDIDSGASAPSVKLILEDSESGNPGIAEQTGQTDVDVQPFTNTDFEGNLRYLVTADVVSLDTTSQPVAGNVTVGNNEVAVYAFNLTTPGAALMENVNFLLTATAEYGTHVSDVKLYRDEGSVSLAWDASDVLVANLSSISGYLKNTATLSEAIDSGGVDYIVTVDVVGGDGQVITMALEAVPGANEGVGLEWPDTISFAQTPGNNFTIVPGAGPSDPPVLANPISGTSAQRTGMGLVDAFYSGFDPNFGAVDYVVGSCQYSLTNGDGNWTVANNGGPSWEYFTDSAQDFSFIWNAAADTNVENDSAFIKIEVKDSDDNSSGPWTTATAIDIDTKEPGTPGDLQNDGVTPNSIDISWAESSGDAGGNWYRYEVYHRACDGCVLDNNQSNGEIQNTVISSAATSTTIGSLLPNTTYTMNIWAADSFNNVAVAGSALTFTTLPAVDTVIVSDYNATLIEPLLVEKGQKYAMFGFTLKSSPGTASLNNATVHLDPASTGDQNDIGSVTLYEDNGTMLGRYDGSDTSVDTMGWDGVDAYTLNNAAINYEIGTSDTKFIMAVTPAIGATDNKMLQFAFSDDTDVTAVSPDTVAAISPKFNGPQYTINKDTLTASRHYLNESAGFVQRGLTYAMFGVNLSSSPGESSLKNMIIHFTGANRTSNIDSVLLYKDNGTSGVYDGADTTLANMVWDNSDAYTISNFADDPAVDSAGEKLILAVRLTGSAVEGDTLSFAFNNASDVTVETPDSMGSVETYSTGAFEIYIPLDTITVADNTGTLAEPTNVDKLQSYAMLGIKLTSVLATANLEDMRIYTANSSTAVDGTDIESVTLCADDNPADGLYSAGTDTTLGNMTWNGGGGYYELNPVDPDYAIDNVSGSELIVVARVAQTAGDGKTLSFRLQNAVGTDIKLNSPSDVINLYSVINGGTLYHYR